MTAMVKSTGERLVHAAGRVNWNGDFVEFYTR